MWFIPPTQKCGLGQSFKGRRDSGGTPNGLEITGTISLVGGGGEEGGRGCEERGGTKWRTNWRKELRRIVVKEGRLEEG